MTSDPGLGCTYSENFFQLCVQAPVPLVKILIARLTTTLIKIFGFPVPKCIVKIVTARIQLPWLQLPQDIAGILLSVLKHVR